MYSEKLSLFHRQVKEGRDLRYAVVLRKWEYAVYAALDGLFAKLGEWVDLASRSAQEARRVVWGAILVLVYGKRRTLLGDVVPNVEHYLIDGKVRIRRYPGKVGGSYKSVPGHGMVRVDEMPEMKLNTDHIMDICKTNMEVKSEATIAERQKKTDKEIMANAKSGSLGNRYWFHRDDPSNEREGI